MLYTAASLIAQQIKEGESYAKLRPVYSIWILDGRLFSDMHRVHTCFQMYSKEADRALGDLVEIHVLQLKDVVSSGTIESEKERWMRFLKEGAHMEAGRLPDYMDTKEMQEAYAIANAFMEDEAQRALYWSRVEAQRVAITNAEEQQETLKQLEKALVEKEQERAAKEQALKAAEQSRLNEEHERAEKERLLQMIKELGHDPERSE